MFPYFQKEVQEVSILAIQDIFSISSSSSNFHIIEKTHSTATAVHQENYSLKSMITCCIPGSLLSSSITSAKLEILSDDRSKIIVLQFLSGDPSIVSSFITDFSNRLHSYIQCPTDNSYFFSKSFRSESESYITHQRKASQNLPTAPSIDIHKILASGEYRYNIRIIEIIDNLQQNISDSIFKTIDTHVDSIYKDIQLHFPLMTATSHYCKSMIEKFIYTKLYSRILAFYIKNCENVDSKFQARKSKLAKLQDHELLTILQVSEKYLLRENPCPYNDARKVLGKFSRLKTPLDKVNCLIATVACMKSCVVEYWKGNTEIQAMDDELPILMFLLLTCELLTPSAEFEILRLYVADRLENEKRIIVNFQSATSYLAIYFAY